MFKLIILIFLFIVNFGVGVKLPSNFKKCNRNQSDFSECLTKAVEDALRQLQKPIRKLGLQLDPVEIKTLSVNGGMVQQNYETFKLWGFSNANCSKVEMNFKTKNLTIECNFPNIKGSFVYQFEGKIFYLPLRGTGPGEFTMDNLKVHQSFKFEEYENEGETYFKIIEVKFIMKPELVSKIYLENLFDGDELLGNQINKMINENWKALFSDIKPSYENVFGQVFSTIFGNLLAKVPVSELFGN